MKTVVFGAGWLGDKIASHFDALLCPLDILDTEAVAHTLLVERPDVVINAAGKCGRPNIDWCISTEERKKLTLYVNAYGPAVLSHTIEAIGNHIGRKPFFVHLSSGCLWDGEHDVDEQTKPEPPSYYSWTKVDAEERLTPADCLILRLRMPIDSEPHERNLITKLSGYQYVLDEPNSVTFVDDFLRAAQHLIETRRTGIYNVVNPGSLTGLDIMWLYCKVVDDNHCCVKVDMEWLKEQGIIKDGRSNCTLNIEKLLAEGVKMPDAKEKIREVMSIYAEKAKTQRKEKPKEADEGAGA